MQLPSFIKLTLACTIAFPYLSFKYATLLSQLPHPPEHDPHHLSNPNFTFTFDVKSLNSFCKVCCSDVNCTNVFAYTVLDEFSCTNCRLDVISVVMAIYASMGNNLIWRDDSIVDRTSGSFNNWIPADWNALVDPMDRML